MWYGKIDELINRLDGEASVLVKNLSTNDVYKYDENKIFPSASMIKVPILLELIDRSCERKINLNDVVEFKKEDIVQGYGIIKSLSPGINMTYRDCALLMIILSDNIATNKLIETLGMDSINEKIREIGMENTILQRKMMDAEAKKKGLDNFISGADLLTIFQYLYSHEKYNIAVDILKKQLCNDLLPVLIGGNIEFAHKTGDLPGVRHDSGIMYLKSPIFIAVLTNNLKNDYDGITFSNEIGKIVYDHYK